MKSGHNGMKRGACAVLASLMLAGTAYGQEDSRGVKVFLDGKELKYDVSPRIVNDRCMVPIGQTIEYLTGSSPLWDDGTKTMSFESNGNNVQHKVGTAVVSVNGRQSMNYGADSFIEDGRTLIPLRMLSEATGCLLVWDAPSKTVILTTPYVDSATQGRTESVKVDAVQREMPGSYNQSKQVELLEVSAVYPEIINATASPENIRPGGSTTITVVTNVSTTRVKMVNLSNDEFFESSEFVESEGKRTFELQWKIMEQGNFSARIYAGNKITYENDYKIVSASTNSSNPIDLIDAYVYTNDVRVGRECYITAITNVNATKVSLNTSKTEDVARTTEHTLDSAGNRVWRLKWTPQAKGYETLTVVADHGRLKDSLSIRINVYDENIQPGIKDIYVDTKDVFAGNVALVTVKTNTAANVVWYECAGYVGEKNFKHYDTDGVRTWYLNVEPLGGADTISAITVYAQDAEGNTAREDLKVNILGAVVVDGDITAYGTGLNSSKAAAALKGREIKSEPVIYGIVSPEGASVGGIAEVFVHTNAAVDTVLLDDNNDPEDENKINFFFGGVNVNGDEKIFSFFVGVDELNPKRIYFTAVGKGGLSVRETFGLPVVIH